jgi:hypothetical protein
MVKRLVEFPLEDGGTVLVQAEAGTAAGGHDGGEVTRGWGNRDERVVLQAQQSFEQAVGRVQPAVQALVRRLRRGGGGLRRRGQLDGQLHRVDDLAARTGSPVRCRPGGVRPG